MANNNINLKVGVDYTELTGLIKTTDQTKRALGLVSKEFANTKDQSAWMRGVMQIVHAQKKLDSSARMTQSEIMKLAHEMRQAAQFSNALSDATASAAGNTQLLGKKTSRFGVLAQQTGYQVGDLVVQIQSGQNAMVALGQQATQLVGTFSMLAKSTKMITVFAGLGIAIPILTGIAAAFFRTREAADESGLAVKAFEERLKAAKQETVDMTQKLEFLKSGFKTEEQFTLNQDLANATAEVDRLKKSLEGINEVPFESESNRLAAISLIQDEIKLAQENKDLAEDALQTYIETLAQLELEEFQRQEDLRLQREQAQAQKDYNSLVTKTTLSQQQQLALSRAILNYGEDSLEVATLRARQEAISKGLLADDLKNYISLALEIRDVVAATEQMAKNQEVLKEGARGFLSIWDSISQKIGEAVGKMALGPSVSGGRGQDPRQFTYLDEFRSQLQDDKPDLSFKGGAGASQQDLLAKLRERIKLDTELLGKTKERQEVERAIANSSVEYSQKAIDKAVAELEAYNQIVEKRQELQGIYDTAQSSMEDGFMAMVEGTKSVKDAFKDMARNIIKELYQVYVIKRMVSGITGAIDLGAGGSLFGGNSWGGTPTPKASGGTVMSNKPYLVGEKGPELIVPRNRGHVMNADLTADAMGGGGTVVVNQSFNFQANGDESVKKIIAQAAPSIANMAKQSVMDARRRGGAMKNTFG